MYNKLIEFRQEIIGALYEDRELFPQERKAYEFEIVDTNHPQIRGAWGHFSDYISLWTTSTNGKVHFCVLEAGNNVFNRDDCNYYFLVEIDAGNKNGESLKLALRWNPDVPISSELIENIDLIRADAFSEYEQEVYDMKRVFNATKEVFLGFCKDMMPPYVIPEQEQYLKQIEDFVIDGNTETKTLFDATQKETLEKHKINYQAIEEVSVLARNIFKKISDFNQLSAEDILIKNYVEITKDKEFKEILKKFMQKIVICDGKTPPGMRSLWEFL